MLRGRSIAADSLTSEEVSPSLVPHSSGEQFAGRQLAKRGEAEMPGAVG